MAWGGGTFITQNKELPGAYINFVSAASVTATLSDRGTVIMPLDLDWGPDDEIFTVEAEDFQKNTMKIFGHAYKDDEMKGLRDLFLNAKTLLAYKLTSGGAKASGQTGEAKYCGTRGNAITVTVQANVDDTTLFDVDTLVDGTKVDEQTVAAAADLADNDFVVFYKDAELASTSGDVFSGGENGTPTGGEYQTFLDKAEAYTFNIVAAAVEDDDTKELIAGWTRTMRDEVGKKFQAVLYDYTVPDYLGVISVKNNVTDGDNPAALVYWVAGLQAGCAVNRSCQNTAYTGGYDVNADYTQAELKAAIKAGEFTLHRTGDSIVVLSDINTQVSVTDDCGEVFKDNQTIRVIDEIANDVATVFVKKYLGLVPNDDAGRVSLWSDIVQIHNQLLDIRAIEDFDSGDVTVAQGDTKKSVVVTDYITVVNAMDKLYMTVTVA